MAPGRHLRFSPNPFDPDKPLQTPILTDHKPLTYSMHSSHSSLSPCEIRQLTFVSEFTTDLRHIRGADNAAADALSRIAVSSVTTPHDTIDFKAMTEAQTHDQELARLRTSSSLTLQDVILPDTNISLTCDLSTGAPRPFVPEPFHFTVFGTLHSFHTPASALPSASSLRATSGPTSIQTSASGHVPACSARSRRSPGTSSHHPRNSHHRSIDRVEHVHIDTVGSLPFFFFEGFRYLLTCIDRYTRWPEAQPIPDITADSVARAFMATWVARLGVPAVITTHRGRQFESKLFQDDLHFLGCHPCSNGLVERLHRQIKTALRCCPDPSSWVDNIPSILLGLRSAVKTDLECSPAELVYGASLHVPGEFLGTPSLGSAPLAAASLDGIREAIRALQPTPIGLPASISPFVFKDIHSSTHVFIRNDATRAPLQPP
ncbi:uncharacterized protein LOC135392464 [Ornithodoros turicata]|uniref:uncharacterized protein LOC135392464 n=1 Tax=Ornithodoros turicata TaxID=34597 RepID=UPI003139494E